MGWTSGSELAEGVWNAVKKHLPTEAKQSVAKEIVRMFEDMDCDTMYEADELMAAAEGTAGRHKGNRR